MINKLMFIIGLSALPYLFTLNGDFVFDDSEAVVKNCDVTSDSWSAPFYNDFWGTNIKSNLSHKSYRPITILTFRINYILNKRNLSALQFKFTNLLCHILCCVLVWKVFQIILTTKFKKYEDSKLQNAYQGSRNKKWWKDTALLSTLLFSVHPIHVEAVSGVVGRADLLAAITFFLAFISYNKSINSQKYKYIYLIYTVIISGISMLCKENGITVLGFCIVYEIVTQISIKKIELKKKSNSLSNKNEVLNVGQNSVYRILFISTSILLLLYARWIVMGGSRPEFKQTDNPTAFSKSIYTKIATYNYIYFLNILLLIWPQWLCYDWSMGCIQLIKNTTDNRLYFVYLMYLYGFFLLYAIINNKNKTSTQRSLILAISLMVIPFLPASNIFYPVGFVIAERILYISSAGYCLLVVIGFNKLFLRKPDILSKIGISMFLLLLLVFTFRILQRSIEWKNEYNLFMGALAVCPLNAKVHYNVAKVADARKQSTLALAEYQEAIRLYPDYYQAMNNYANILKNLKQYNEAEYYLRSAVKLKEDFPAAWMNLGIVLASTGKYEESDLVYKKAISYRKKYPDCYYNMGNLYLEMNRTEDAIHSWLQAINQNPKHVLAWTNLMALLDNTGQIERALKIIPRVLSEIPDAPSINFAIANIYGKINRYEEAEAHFLKAIKLFGKDLQPIHYANLGVLYHRWKKYDLAEEMYRNALKINKNFKTAQKNLESLQKLNMA